MRTRRGGITLRREHPRRSPSRGLFGWSRKTDAQRRAEKLQELRFKVAQTQAKDAIQAQKDAAKTRRLEQKALKVQTSNAKRDSKTAARQAKNEAKKTRIVARQERANRKAQRAADRDAKGPGFFSKIGHNIAGPSAARVEAGTQKAGVVISHPIVSTRYGINKVRNAVRKPVETKPIWSED